MFPNRNDEALCKRPELGGFNYIRSGHQTHSVQFEMQFFNSMLCSHPWYLHVLCSHQVKERTLRRESAYPVLCQGTVHHWQIKERRWRRKRRRYVTQDYQARSSLLTEGGACLVSHGGLWSSDGWKTRELITEGAALDFRADRSGFKSCLYFWVHVLSKLVSRNLS